MTNATTFNVRKLLNAVDKRFFARNVNLTGVICLPKMSTNRD